MPEVIDGKEHEVEVLSSRRLRTKAWCPAGWTSGVEAVSCCAAGSFAG